MQCERGVQYLKGTSAVLLQGVRCEEKVYGKKECHICSTWTENTQYKDKVKQCEEKVVQNDERVYNIRRVHLQ